jgi:hypothetical protein
VRDGNPALAPAEHSSYVAPPPAGVGSWPAWIVMTQPEDCHGGVERRVELEEVSRT